MHLRILLVGISLVMFAGAYGFAENSIAMADFPKIMPPDVKMVYYTESGLTGSWRRVEIFEKKIAVEIKEARARQTKSWEANITREKAISIYRMFADNKFNKINNKKQREVVNDAGLETLSVRAGKVDKSVSFSENSPLSGKNTQSFKTIAKSIQDLVGKYEPERKGN